MWNELLCKLNKITKNAFYVKFSSSQQCYTVFDPFDDCVRCDGREYYWSSEKIPKSVDVHSSGLKCDNIQKNINGKTINLTICYNPNENFIPSEITNYKDTIVLLHTDANHCKNDLIKYGFSEVNPNPRRNTGKIFIKNNLRNYKLCGYNIENISYIPCRFNYNLCFVKV